MSCCSSPFPLLADGEVTPTGPTALMDHKDDTAPGPHLPPEVPVASTPNPSQVTLIPQRRKQRAKPTQQDLLSQEAKMAPGVVVAH